MDKCQVSKRKAGTYLVRPAALAPLLPLVQWLCTKAGAAYYCAFVFVCYVLFFFQADNDTQPTLMTTRKKASSSSSSTLSIGTIISIIALCVIVAVLVVVVLKRRDNKNRRSQLDEALSKVDANCCWVMHFHRTEDGKKHLPFWQRHEKQTKQPIPGTSQWRQPAFGRLWGHRPGLASGATPPPGKPHLQEAQPTTSAMNYS